MCEINEKEFNEMLKARRKNKLYMESKSILKDLQNRKFTENGVPINGDKIISAGVLLPLTEDPKLSWKYGTRHRAAIGMTENSDAACLVVSEETGDVSIAIDGSLKKYEDLVTLKSDLENILDYKDKLEEDKKTIFKINNFMTIKKSVKDESGKV